MLSLLLLQVRRHLPRRAQCVQQGWPPPAPDAAPICTALQQLAQGDIQRYWLRPSPCKDACAALSWPQAHTQQVPSASNTAAGSRHAAACLCHCVGAPLKFQLNHAQSMHTPCSNPRLPTGGCLRLASAWCLPLPYRRCVSERQVLGRFSRLQHLDMSYSVAKGSLADVAAVVAQLPELQQLHLRGVGLAGPFGCELLDAAR